MDHIRLICFLMLFCSAFSASAVPVIFRNSGGVLVRSPSGAIVSKPGIADLLNSSVGDIAGSAKKYGNLPITIEGKGVAIKIAKQYPAANLAKTAAEALLSKAGLVGIAASLAIPYVWDEVSDSLNKQITPAPVSPITTANPASNAYCWNNTTTCANSFYEAGKKIYTQPEFNFCYATFLTNNNGLYSYELRYGFNGSCGGINTGYFKSSHCPSGSSGDPSLANCALTNPTCTSPSTYDSVTGMCVGSAINEPANATQLEQDIKDTLENSPEKAPTLLDDLLEHAFEPEPRPEDKDTSTVEEISPSSVQGETKTIEKNYFDPATGDPMTDVVTVTATFTPKIGSDGRSIDVESSQTSTTTKTNNATQAVTTSTQTETVSAPTNEVKSAEEQTITDCDKYPETIGCSEYGETPVAEILPTENLPITITPSFAPEGTCPAPQVVQTSHGAVMIPWEPTCNLAIKSKPLILAVAWLVAGSMVVVSARRA